MKEALVAFPETNNPCTTVEDKGIDALEEILATLGIAALASYSAKSARETDLEPTFFTKRIVSPTRGAEPATISKTKVAGKGTANEASH